jgi:hypothetical protein
MKPEPGDQACYSELPQKKRVRKVEFTSKKSIIIDKDAKE